MSLHVKLYWSVRSPYSYLATPQLFDLARLYDVSIQVRPVYPHALRNKTLAATRDAMWVNYFKTDIVRVADYLGLPLAWPRPDPVAVDSRTGTVLQAQPRVQRLTRLVQAAEEAGAGLAFIHALSTRLWHPDTTNWEEDGVLNAAATEAELDLARLEAHIEAQPQDFERRIEANQHAEVEDGHWGVPVMVFNGEPFFGQDRIDHLIWRMKQAGLQAREG